MRKKAIFIILVLIFISTNAGAQTIIDTIDYKEDKLVMIPGDLILTLNQTTEDISLLLRLYDSVSNVTVYSVRSNEINIDDSFINDTKPYYFIDQYLNDYIIFINYSSIQLPPTNDEIIAGYISIIENLTNNNTILLLKIESLELSLNQSYEIINETQLLINDEIEKRQPLLDQLLNYSTALSENYLRYEELEEYNKTNTERLNEYRDSFCLFTTEGIYFNFSSAIITLLVAMIIATIMFSRMTNRPIPVLEPIKTILFKQQAKNRLKEPEGSPKDMEILKNIKEKKI